MKAKVGGAPSCSIAPGGTFAATPRPRGASVAVCGVRGTSTLTGFALKQVKGGRAESLDEGYSGVSIKKVRISFHNVNTCTLMGVCVCVCVCLFVGVSCVHSTLHACKLLANTTFRA